MATTTTVTNNYTNGPRTHQEDPGSQLIHFNTRARTYTHTHKKKRENGFIIPLNQYQQ